MRSALLCPSEPTQSSCCKSLAVEQCYRAIRVSTPPRFRGLFPSPKIGSKCRVRWPKCQRSLNLLDLIELFATAEEAGLGQFFVAHDRGDCFLDWTFGRSGEAQPKCRRGRATRCGRGRCGVRFLSGAAGQCGGSNGSFEYELQREKSCHEIPNDQKACDCVTSVSAAALEAAAAAAAARRRREQRQHTCIGVRRQRKSKFL